MSGDDARGRKGLTVAIAGAMIVVAACVLLARYHRLAVSMAVPVAESGAIREGADASHGKVTAKSKSHATTRQERPAAAPPRRLPSSSLPPPGTPLAQIYDELKARADAGDADAATRLFDDVRDCFWAREKFRTLPRRLEDLGSSPQASSANGIAQREELLASMEKNLQKALGLSTECANLSDAQMQIAPAAFEAARLGDLEASDCYVSGAVLWTGGILDHPEWLTQYRQNARAIADNAVALGDWSMVTQLQVAYSPDRFRFGPLAEMTGVDAAMSYRYLKLRRLGTVEEAAAGQLDRELANAAENLPPDAIAAGDAWAQDTFAHYFGGGPPANQSHFSRHCGFY